MKVTDISVSTQHFPANHMMANVINNDINDNNCVYEMLIKIPSMAGHL